MECTAPLLCLDRLLFDLFVVHCRQCLSQGLTMPEDMHISVSIAFEKRQCILLAALKDAYVCILLNPTYISTARPLISDVNTNQHGAH